MRQWAHGEGSCYRVGEPLGVQRHAWYRVTAHPHSQGANRHLAGVPFPFHICGWRLVDACVSEMVGVPISKIKNKKF